MIQYKCQAIGRYILCINIQEVLCIDHLWLFVDQVKVGCQMDSCVHTSRLIRDLLKEKEIAHVIKCAQFSNFVNSFIFAYVILDFYTYIHFLRTIINEKLSKVRLLLLWTIVDGWMLAGLL